MSGGLTTKPGSRPASSFRMGDPFNPGSHAYAERHAVHTHEMMPGLIRVDIGAVPSVSCEAVTPTEGTSKDA